MKLYLITGFVFAVLDFCWLSIMVPKVYRRQMGSLMSDSLVWPAAIGFYLIYTITLYFLIVAPAADRGSLTEAAMRGALFGLATYGTYNLTNLATLKNWPHQLIYIDIAWGVILSSATACLAVWINSKI